MVRYLTDQQNQQHTQLTALVQSVLNSRVPPNGTGGFRDQLNLTERRNFTQAVPEFDGKPESLEAFKRDLERFLELELGYPAYLAAIERAAGESGLKELPESALWKLLGCLGANYLISTNNFTAYCTTD